MIFLFENRILNAIRIICGSLLLSSTFVEGAASQNKQRLIAEQERANSLRDMHLILSNLRHEVSNHETEIRMIDEKLVNHLDAIETLRQKIVDGVQTQKDILKGYISSFDVKIDALDTKTKSLTSDMNTIKNHANDTSTVLMQYKHKIADLESIVKEQKQQMSLLETALKQLIELMQTKDIANDPIEGATKTYRVQPGDTLEKIAKSQKTTIRALKDSNNLSQDKIVVGQKLLIP